MFEAPESPYRVPYEGELDLASAPTRISGAPSKARCKKLLAEAVDELSDLQRRLYAHDRHAVLLVFQALDAAGKDGTIRAVLSGVNPQGCQVVSFGPPSHEEREHDFLWRSARRLPERGRIGVFNRSYYEEVLAARVHPEHLDAQRLPDRPPLAELWQQRYASIRDHELHLARNGTLVLKFFLHVSKEEQRRRFLSRIDEPEKNWKFHDADVHARSFWDAYQEAYRDALAATSRSWAPWYAVPADDKPAMRLAVARLVVESLDSLGLHYPQVDDARRRELLQMRGELAEEEG